jgi:hypothetical protein
VWLDGHHSEQSSFPRQRLDIAAMFSLASAKLSATSLSPNPALAKHFFTVSALILFTANPSNSQHPERIQILLMRKSYRLLKRKGKVIPVTGREGP